MACIASSVPPGSADEDVEAITKGYSDRERIVEQSLREDIDELLASPDTKDRTVAIATLIAVWRMDIRIAYRPPQMGLFHEKLGIFEDRFGGSVSFKGSSNETWNGWYDLGNHESFEVFCSWIPAEAERIARHKAYFQRLWEGHVANIVTIAVPDGALRLLKSAAKVSLEDVTLQRTKPHRRPLLTHQALAVANWEGRRLTRDLRARHGQWKDHCCPCRHKQAPEHRIARPGIGPE